METLVRIMDLTFSLFGIIGGSMLIFCIVIFVYRTYNIHKLNRNLMR